MAIQLSPPPPLGARCPTQHHLTYSASTFYSLLYDLPPLPTTYYLLPTTYYLLPTTYYLLPTPYYLQFINVLPASRGDDAAPRLQRVRGIALELPLLAGLGLAPRRSQRLPAPGAPSLTVHFRR